VPPETPPSSGRRLILPSWIPCDQPLYLNRSICDRIRRDFDENGIFLNIPYGERYSRLEVAIISTVTAYGLRPKMARQRLRLEVRLLKIAEMMCTCRYGLTDLSYVKRLNMPLELGMLLAFGKETFITSRKPYGALKSISDLNFSDIHYHRGSPRELIVWLSRWIEQICSRKRFSTRTLLRRYRRLWRIRRDLGKDFDKLLPQEITKFLDVQREELRLRLPEK
jgi:hypothetical protein